MLKKLALKRLTASDLTFFEWHYRSRNAGNQKAINLNTDVFISAAILAARREFGLSRKAQNTRN